MGAQCQVLSTGGTAVYFVPNYLGLYSVKVISTENSVQRLRNKKLNKTKCDFLGQIRLVTSSPDSPTPSDPWGGVGAIYNVFSGGLSENTSTKEIRNFTAHFLFLGVQ